jgi:multimeric flavodoxin WrbA
MKRILAVSGSPRKGGNTEGLLNAALDECRAAGFETDTFYLSEHPIKPCIGCELCTEEKRCVLSGDDMEAFIERADLCDAILIGSPVYYRNVTAQLKALFDRTHGYDAMRLFKGKPCGAITVGRGEGGGQALALTVIYNFLLSSGAVCVPGELNGVTARADKPGDIASQPRRLEQSKILVRNVMDCAEKLRRA